MPGVDFAKAKKILKVSGFVAGVIFYRTSVWPYLQRRKREAAEIDSIEVLKIRGILPKES